ncbi:DUF6406 domain-containing protein [Streptomyces sp. NBC_01244]|uniref:DUF6406 domain-containing protein n=1 Tax=Streptomyces sp. NBC_01244 TaxID=2903797 RepID=UPI002E0F9FB8|nr:hypothetical protein OG247_29880 [Streptomyces sp. NBC_01244]
MASEVSIRRGAPTRTSIALFDVIDVDARPGLPLTVRLGFDDGEEHRYTLEPGDTFSVRDETWVLDRVEDPAGNWRVFIRRVE